MPWDLWERDNEGFVCERELMDWINVKNSLPLPWQVVWIYWRDREVLLGCRTYEGEEAIKCEPTDGWYSFDDEKCRWTNWWMPVDRSSFDKPQPPKED